MTQLAARRPYFDNRELSVIAMLASLQFAVSFAANVFGTAVYAFLGPFYVFLDGIGSEGARCVLLSAAIALVPRIGTATLTILTVALLNAVITGTFVVPSFVQMGIGIIVFESVLVLFGVTLERSTRRRTGRQLSTSLIARTAVAIGCANCIKLFTQYFVSMYFYRFDFDMWFVYSAALVTGLLYGAIGAAIGAAWGIRLRRTAP